MLVEFTKHDRIYRFDMSKLNTNYAKKVVKSFRFAKVQTLAVFSMIEYPKVQRFPQFLTRAVLSFSLMVVANIGIADYALKPIALQAYDSEVSKEVRCLAMNIYHEARGESTMGQKAVASVIMNRVRSPHYPDSICEVVWQPKQFSWTINHEKHHAVNDPKAWRKAIIIAQATLAGHEYDQIGLATHYHAISVDPYWTDYGRFVAQVGQHLFYTMDV